jgi:HK97 gp10 family phage protein
MANVQGLDRLSKKLKALPPAAEAAIRTAMEQSADEIVMQMKRLAPVDNGELQMSISWTWGDAPKGSLKIGTVASRSGSMRITIFAGNEKAYYARFVEFGTAPHIAGGKFTGAKIPAIRAQPFFYVAFRAGRKRAKSRVSRAITKAAKQVAAGG